MELNDKIGIVDKEMFHRMLGIKAHENLPDFLLVEYFRVKKLLDKVDGSVGAFGLARIAMQCGFDPDEMEFNFKAHTIKAKAMEFPVGFGSGASGKEDASEETLVSGTTQGPPAEAPPEAVEVPDEEPSPIPEPLRTPEPNYTPGQSVQIIQDDQILIGKVVGTNEKDGTYTVLCDDNEQTYEVSEDEIGEL